MADKLVTIARFANSMEANFAKQLLDNCGIKSVIIGENTANVYAGIPAIADIKLQTMEAQAKQAIEILESQQQKE